MNKLVNHPTHKILWGSNQQKNSSSRNTMSAMSKHWLLNLRNNLVLLMFSFENMMNILWPRTKLIDCLFTSMSNKIKGSGRNECKLNRNMTILVHGLPGNFFCYFEFSKYRICYSRLENRVCCGSHTSWSLNVFIAQFVEECWMFSVKIWRKPERHRTTQTNQIVFWERERERKRPRNINTDTVQF